ncbi:MAG: NFACT RNA binding domain-containing protein, partial [Planctomycetota bacterium]
MPMAQDHSSRSPTPSSPPLSDDARRLSRALERALERADRREAKLRRGRADCEAAAGIREEGELLKAGLSSLRRGMKEATVPDFYADRPQATRTILLDPAQSPRESMERRFQKAAKLERGREKIEAEIARNAARRKDLLALTEAVRSWCEKSGPEAPLPEKLLLRARHLRVRGLFEAPSGGPKNQRAPARAAVLKNVRVFTSLDGIEILVGKSGPGNDLLSFRLARGNDWWFHLAPASGSHVVARSPKDASLPQETLLDAATLAVHFSKMRGARRAEVTYTQARHVKRIRG